MAEVYDIASMDHPSRMLPGGNKTGIWKTRELSRKSAALNNKYFQRPTFHPSLPDFLKLMASMSEVIRALIVLLEKGKRKNNSLLVEKIFAMPGIPPM